MRPPPGATPAACCPDIHHPNRLRAEEGTLGTREQRGASSKQDRDKDGESVPRLPRNLSACQFLLSAAHLRPHCRPRHHDKKEQNQAKSTPIFLSYPFHRAPLSFIRSRVLSVSVSLCFSQISTLKCSQTSPLYSLAVVTAWPKPAPPQSSPKPAQVLLGCGAKPGLLCPSPSSKIQDESPSSP